jgi:hypothetical protein
LEDLPPAVPPEDRWQISLRPLSLTVEEGEEDPWQPHLLLIVESGRGAVLGHRLLESVPDPDLVIDLLFATMGEPALGVPRRPGKIQTDSDALLPPLKELGALLQIEIEQLPDLPELSYAIHAFEEFISAKPGLYLDAEDADPDLIREFFNDAANFYRRACWKRITDSEPLTLIFMDEDSEEALYAVVMGNGGIVRGLALYEDAEDLEDLYYDEGSLDPREVACTSLVYVEKQEAPEEQIAEIKEHGWNVVSNKALPMATRTDALGPPRMPAREQLLQLQVALIVIPGFVERLPKKQEARISGEPEPFEVTLGDETFQGFIGYGMFVDEEMEEDEEEA